jgi:hypothetical protein
LGTLFSWGNDRSLDVVPQQTLPKKTC